MSSLDQPRDRTSPSDLAVTDAVAAAERLTDLLATVIRNGDVAAMPSGVLQSVFAALVAFHGERFDSGERTLPIPEGSDVSATAVMVTTTGLLQAANLEIFELGMWQTWSGTR